MLKRLLFLASFIIIVSSCKKEVFPDTDDLKGTWIEKTDNDFKHKLIFEDKLVYFIQPDETNTWSYWLREDDKIMILNDKDADNHEGGSPHQIVYNRRTKVLSIEGLYPSRMQPIITEFNKEK